MMGTLYSLHNFPYHLLSEMGGSGAENNDDLTYSE